MAIRRPLKLDKGSGDLRDFTVDEVDTIVDEVIRQYGLSPAVALTINQGSGNLTQLTETRAIAGAIASSTTAVPPTAPATSTITVAYNNTVQTITNQTFPYRTGTNWGNFSYPVYKTSTNDIRAMDAIDVYDTFITPALNRLVESSTESYAQAGTYFISTNQSESGSTQVGAAPVAADTNADIVAFATGSLPETLDQPSTVNRFWLHRVDPVSEFSYTAPVSMRLNDCDLQITPRSTFGEMIQALVNHYASTKLRYNFYASSDTSFGNARGTGITDTYTTGSLTRYDYVYGSTYYAQNVPTGTPSVQSTHFLRIGLI
jgi:hypothetical protein